MATVTLDMPDEDQVRVVTALCAVNGYQQEVPDPENPGEMIPNPVDPMEFSKQQVIAFLIATTVAYEKSIAAEPAPPVMS